MEIWTRPDGRFYCSELGRDLFGLAVIVYYGGYRRSRVRIVAVDSPANGEKLMAMMAARRAKHGYQRVDESPPA
ncbi:MAG TPA: hypothetical protein PLR37_06600 [Candidatus Accumulibacter phosphatis]|nr:hypothetical protein [Accumulibacter sp.]HRF11790.1 hypothetical protein [Candidatus Accumulibacter phosphatis]